MKRKLIRKNRGITLVALVITIIILLILAGVTIAQLTGNGLFENSKQAQEEYEISADIETLKMEYSEYNIDKLNWKEYITFLQYLDTKEYLVMYYDTTKEVGEVILNERVYEINTTGVLKITYIGKDDGKVRKIELDKEQAAVGLGETITLTATISPSYAIDKTLVWTSSNDSIASVSNEGIVTGVAAGKVTITCQSNDGGTSAECQVEVLDGTLIYNRADLAAINSNPSGNYILMNDIDLSDGNWSPICGAAGNAFTGTFDGNGYSIKNLTVTSKAYYGARFIWSYF